MKSFADPRTAAEALRRSEALRAGEVPTPAGRPGACANEVEFDRIEGRSGLPVLAAGLPALLGPVARLHAARVAGLADFDPLLRVRPRLALASAHEVRAVLDDPVPRGAATLHGDLHAGQFVCDRSGRVWILDFDDLALGPPEADLANFAAHLATSRGGGIALWAGRVRASWLGLGRRCDTEVFGRFLRFALVRRHLKLRAAGRPDFEAPVVAYLRESSNFSIL